MRITRVFVEGPLCSGQRATLSDSAHQHLVRALRLVEGAEVQAFDGIGNAWRARLAQVGKRGSEIDLLEPIAALPESGLRIELGQALARGEKMDLVLQKATELGVAHIAPLITERSEVKLDAERAERRLGHWRGVLIHACEQCGRARLPDLQSPIRIEHWASALTAPLKLMLDPDAELGIAQASQALRRPDPCVGLAIGPEGGFGSRDLQALRDAGFIAVRLGPRVLRTETAGLASIAILQALVGDLR
jgi:16S rRNA (uracil1498-N3)-methyltransferase